MKEEIIEYDQYGNVICKKTTEKEVPPDLAILKHLSEIEGNVIIDEVYTAEDIYKAIMDGAELIANAPTKCIGYLTRLDGVKLFDLETHDKQVRADTAREIIEKIKNGAKIETTISADGYKIKCTVTHTLVDKLSEQYNQKGET